MRACWSVSRLSSGSGGGPKRSAQLLAQLLQLGDLAGGGDPAVDVDLGLLVGDVVGRHVGVDVDVEAHGLRASSGSSPSSSAAIACDGLVEHLHVELEAERGDVAGLLVAEQVAGAAQLEVAHGDLEAGAELGVVRQRRQAVAPPPPSGPPRSGTAGTRRRARGCGRRARGSGRAGSGRRRRRGRRSACSPAGCRSPTR